ncbi:MAG: ROK family protein [Ignavibacteriaceae bacterium]
MGKSLKTAVGVDLGGTNIKIGIVANDGRILEKTSVKTEAAGGPEQVIENIKFGINEILNNSSHRIKGIGIGCPGIINLKKGTVENPPNLPGWKKVKLGSIIQKEFKINVHVENDANAAAIGEMIFGSGKKFTSFIMVTLGTGVGGGIVFNRKIFRGEFGAAGEIGHVSIDGNGPKCNCGSTGCIEAFVGNQYLKDRVKTDLANHTDSKIWDLIDNDLANVTPKIIQAAAELDDEFAKQVILKMGIQLGTAFASLSNVLDISTFIIGGGVAGFGKPLLNTIHNTTAARVLTPLRNRVKVIPAKLKNDAGIKGASALVFYNM